MKLNLIKPNQEKKPVLHASQGVTSNRHRFAKQNKTSDQAVKMAFHFTKLMYNGN